MQGGSIALEILAIPKLAIGLSDKLQSTLPGDRIQNPRVRNAPLPPPREFC